MNISVTKKKIILKQKKGREMTNSLDEKILSVDRDVTTVDSGFCVLRAECWCYLKNDMKPGFSVVLYTVKLYRPSSREWLPLTNVTAATEKLGHYSVIISQH